MLITLLLLFGGLLESHDVVLAEKLNKCILFKTKNNTGLAGCLYVPNRYPLHKFKPKNVPKEEKIHMTPLFTIDTPLYQDWGIMDKPDHVVLAFNEEKIIGGARVIKYKKNDYIEHLYVLHEHRGQSVGSQLLDICSVIAHYRKKKFLQLDAVPTELTEDSFAKLEKFYINRGFINHQGNLKKKTSSIFEYDTIEEIKYF